MSRRIQRIAVATGLATLGCVAYLIFDRTNKLPAASRRDVVAASALHATSASPVPDGVAPVPRAKRALPLASTPLALINDELKARADRGDALAACRLGLELLRCRDLPRARKSLDQRTSTDLEGSAEPGLSAAMAQSVREHERRYRDAIAATELQCGTMTNTPNGEATAYLRQAALAGIPEAMVRYTDGNTFEGEGLAFLRDPEFATWRREAPRMVERALKLGEPAAVFQLWLATSDDNTLLGALIPDDPQAAARYRILIGLLSGKPPRSLPSLPADELQLAHLEARQMHREFFHSRTLRPGEMGSHLQPLIPNTEPMAQVLCE